MWARGLERRPIDGALRAAGRARRGASRRSSCRAATPFTFTAPNLQYLMDSPAEFSAFTLRTFTVPDERRTPVFRVAVHHTGTRRRARRASRATSRRSSREARHVFGEYPAVRGQHLHVHRRLPAVGQRRRHGASQQHGPHLVVARFAPAALDLLDTVAHEFFHRGTSSASARSRSSRSTRGGEHVGRAVARRRLHQLLRSARS